MNFPYKWNLKDGYPAKGIPNHKSKVFSCFCCGGGSSMGYKLAGYQVLGGIEVDPKIASIYVKNHNPKYMYQEDIRDFLNSNDTPEELFELDILDGSPPCTPFSMCGIREKGWGVERNYAEGRIKQKLDDLFGVFIQLLKKLQPKISVIENVLGLNKGNAKKYMSLIGNAINDAGYDFFWKMLDSSLMGVPQKRQRIFFICIRKDLIIKKSGLLNNKPIINLKFNENIIPFKEISDNSDVKENPYNNLGPKYWRLCKPGFSFSSVSKTGGWFNQTKVSNNGPAPTLISSCADGAWHPTICRPLNKKEWINASTFPQDYDFSNKLHYIIGNSVPPVMMAQISYRIYQQWLSKL
jgi:DNA (cytosine-5)-methyltransferase 1